MTGFIIYDGINTNGYRSTLSWNRYGQLISLTDPLGSSKRYTYDQGPSIFVTHIVQSGAGVSDHTSQMSWYYPRGLLASQRDANGQIQYHQYDGYGRPSALYTPYDGPRDNASSIPALFYEYGRQANGQLYARTRTKLTLNPTDDSRISTLVLLDGLGRAIYTAKSGYIADPDYTGSDYTSSAAGTLGWNISGAIRYDTKGRIIAQGQPTFQRGSPNSPFDTLTLPDAPRVVNPTLTSYDALDRPIQVIYPSSGQDGVIRESYAYSIEGQRALMRLTDPLGVISTSISDIRGRITALWKHHQNEKLADVRYQYDVLGQLLRVSYDTSIDDALDSQEYHVDFTYDLRGLTTSTTSDERGRITLSYDQRGNLSRKEDPNLTQAGSRIDYFYDTLGRLIRIDYPRMRDVTYTYGDPTNTNHQTKNAIGRLLTRVDESGTIHYTYGKMGEIIEETRTLNSQKVASTPTKTATISFQSDYLGRINTVSYPDGEVLSYGYDAAGQLSRVSSVRRSGSNSSDTTFIKRIGYDEFGQRSFIIYGNGVRSDYSYDPYRRWLDTLSSVNEHQHQLQNLSYTFDAVGNVLTRREQGRYATSEHQYQYDGLYQLISAEGSFRNHPYGQNAGSSESWQRRYEQRYRYDSLFNMTHKTSREVRSPLSHEVGALNYSLDYTYDEEKPHQAIRIADKYYLYDDNGNVIEESELPLHATLPDRRITTFRRIGDVRVADKAWGIYDRDGGQSDRPYYREFRWDEENRLKNVIGQGSNTSFLYDGDGERTSKMGERGETLYFSPWWSISEDGTNYRQSKHIFVGKERIVTRLSPETGYNWGA